MSETRTKGRLIAAAIWIVIFIALAVAAKYFLLPYFKKDLLDKTGSSSKYKNEITIAVDGFSGYCVLRSPVMKNDLKSQGIKLVVQDDKADYPARVKALADRKVQMAVFTIDSFLAAGAGFGQFPATIVLIIDETKGADAIVAYKTGLESLQDLDDPSARIVLTPASPSEFLARTVVAHFNLPNLPEKWWEEANGAGDVYQKFLAADPTAKRAFVMWEPYVSKALERPEAHLLLDSSKLKGYIVDVLVVERNFLSEHPDLVRAVVEAYFRAAYSYSEKSAGMVELVTDDARETGAESLTPEQAEKLVAGIEWKNTLENYTYFGIASDKAPKAAPGQLLEDIIVNITEVLVKTSALPQDPLGGKPYTIYYDAVLRELMASGFHPSKKLNLIDGMGPGTEDLDGVHAEAELASLSDDEWKALSPVAEMRVPPLSFARGTDRLNIQSERDLDELVRKLDAWPQYYLRISGHARAEGDAQANLELAASRAEAVTTYLLDKGVSKDRVKALPTPPSLKNGSAQSVSFELLQKPY